MRHVLIITCASLVALVCGLAYVMPEILSYEMKPAGTLMVALASLAVVWQLGVLVKVADYQRNQAVLLKDELEQDKINDASRRLQAHQGDEAELPPDRKQAHRPTHFTQLTCHTDSISLYCSGVNGVFECPQAKMRG